MATTVKDIQVCFNPHFDAVSLWIGSFGGEDSPCDISRGVFSAKRGVPRLLEMFRRYRITTTWHITGHSIESFPRAAEMVVRDGHEIGLHGYAHENPLSMSRAQETDVLDRSIELIEKLTGKRPVGYSAPWWELSPHTIDLLLSRGILYDASMMEDDFFPFYLRKGDRWTKIDYSRNAADWMKPWQAGTEVDLVGIPASWHLTDSPATIFIKKFPNSHGWVTGQALGQIWQDQFDWVYRHHDYAVFPVSMHPDTAAKPHVLAMVERCLDHMLSHSGVRMVTMAEMAADFRKRAPFGQKVEIGGPTGL